MRAGGGWGRRAQGLARLSKPRAVVSAKLAARMCEMAWKRDRGSVGDWEGRAARQPDGTTCRT
eukprot:5604826-Pleurochrysis_carterae.AAC.1